MNLTPDKMKSLIPRVENWIDGYIAENKTKRIRIVDIRFPRLSFFFSKRLLSNAYMVSVETIKTPPLTEFGLEELSFFEGVTYGGVTYKDTYFISKGLEQEESLHFHELIHIIQWDELGAQNICYLYGIGLLQFGYRNSPLEKIAFDYQEKFDRGEKINHLESKIRTHCQNCLQNID